MRPGGGKAKGSEFERRVCKSLSLWVSHNAKEDLFWRSAMSGGRATVGRRKGKDFGKHAGDISATAPEGHKLTDHFFIECKFVKDLRLGNFMMHQPSVIRNYWDVAFKQAEEHGRAPMLIAKQNLGIVLCLIPSEEAKGFTWAKESAIARVMLDAFTSCAVLRFEQMVQQPFSMRWRWD